MDVNLNQQVKVVNVPIIPATEVADREKSQVRPIEQGGEAGQLALDAKTLKGKKKDEEKSGPEVLSPEKMKEVAGELQSRLESLGNQLGFTLIQESNAWVIEVTDRETGKVIRQVPPDDLLRLKAKIDEVIGILFDKKV